MSRAATAILAALIAAGTVGALAVADPSPATFNGEAIVVDGDTLRVSGVRVRLAAIDAPERGQQCSMPCRHVGAPAQCLYDCGEASTRALQRMIERDPRVTCQATATDRYGRTIATCRNSGGDLGQRMVALGMVVRYERYAGDAYRDEQAAAKAGRIGLWRGDFIMPEQYRRANR
jgi:endonuclease YncB( thermonuclease family)